MKRTKTKSKKTESKRSIMQNDPKIERLLKAAKAFAYPENMLGIRKENGVEEAFQAGASNACHKETFEKCSRFEIFVGKEELTEIRAALTDLENK